MLCGELSALSFHRCKVDHAIIFRHGQSSTIVMAIHVDDCIITGSNVKEIQRVKGELNKKFRLMDLGPISWVLGITVTCNHMAHMLSLSQHNYIEGILA